MADTVSAGQRIAPVMGQDEDGVAVGANPCEPRIAVTVEDDKARRRRRLARSHPGFHGSEATGKRHTNQSSIWAEAITR